MVKHVFNLFKHSCSSQFSLLGTGWRNCYFVPSTKILTSMSVLQADPKHLEAKIYAKQTMVVNNTIVLEIFGAKQLGSSVDKPASNRYRKVEET